MIEINEKIEKLLIENGSVGCFSEMGAVIGDLEFVLYYPENSKKIYLAHISEFIQRGSFVSLKEVSKN